MPTKPALYPVRTREVFREGAKLALAAKAEMWPPNSSQLSPTAQKTAILASIQ